MKIHELSKISQVNPETIRMYRTRGFLRPGVNPSNGYYEYTVEDMVNLLFIRRQRMLGIPLQDIARTYSFENLKELMDDYENAIGQIDLEIETLLEKRKALVLTQEHLSSCISFSSDVPGEAEKDLDGTDTEMKKTDVKEIQVKDGRYDYYMLDQEHFGEVQTWMQNMEQFVVCLKIQPELLLSEETNAHIPLKIGIGTYQNLFEKYNLPIPKGAVYCPPGRFLTTMIELDQLDHIPADCIRPLKEYAKKHRLCITGESTAFLIRVNHTKEKESFVFRLRIRVEEKKPA